MSEVHVKIESENQKANPFENFVDDVMRFNQLEGDQSFVFEDKNYGTKYEFFKTHAIVNDERTGFKDEKYEYGSKQEGGDYIEDIVDTSKRLDELANVVPSGNLERYGGKRGLAKSILMVKLAERGLPQDSDETK